MDKEKLRKNLEERVFGEYKNEVRVVMPKQFLAELSNILNKQQKEISDIIIGKDKRTDDLFKELVKENERTRELTVELREAIKDNRVDKIEITNFPEQKEVKIPDFPSEINLAKPKWYEKFKPDKILEYIKGGFEYSGKQFAEALNRHTKKENALAVRLVDKEGKTFYDAVFQAISGGGFRNVTVDNFPTIFNVRLYDAAGTGLTSTTVGASEALDINIVGGAAAGGTSSADDADFVAGTTLGTQIQGVYESVETNVTDGDVGQMGITQDRHLKVEEQGTPAVTMATLPDTAGNDLADIETNTDSGAVIGGGTEATAQRVTIANNSTGVLSVDDNGSALTVDQTTHDNLNANANVQQGDADVGAGNPLQVSLANTGANATAVKVDNSGVTQPVSATDLDIRDLTHVSDSVKVGDGVETANVNASNELQVRDDDANTDLDTIVTKTTDIETNTNSGAVVGGGTEASAQRVTIANNSTGLLSVDDNASSLTVDTTGTSGLEVIQATAADLNVTEASASSIKTAVESMDGAIIGPGEPTIDSYTQIAINLTTGTNQVLVSSAASKQIWVYGFGLTVGDADGQTVSFQDEDDTAITGIMEFVQYGGMAVAPSGNFAMPIWKLATNKDLEVDITGGDVDGWLAYAIVSV